MDDSEPRLVDEGHRDGHPTAELLGSYLDGALGPEAASALEEHLNRCAACRADLVEARLALRAVGRRRKLIAALPLVAAASLAAIVPLALFDRATQAPTLLRDADREVTMVAIQPVDNGPVAGDVRFVWSNSGVGATYLLTVTDPAGNRVYEARTADTTVLVPSTELADGGGSFFWFVDALLEDGRSARTDLTRFRIR